MRKSAIVLILLITACAQELILPFHCLKIITHIKFMILVVRRSFPLSWFLPFWTVTCYRDHWTCSRISSNRGWKWGITWKDTRRSLRSTCKRPRKTRRPGLSNRQRVLLLLLSSIGKLLAKWVHLSVCPGRTVSSLVLPEVLFLVSLSQRQWALFAVQVVQIPRWSCQQLLKYLNSLSLCSAYVNKSIRIYSMGLVCITFFGIFLKMCLRRERRKRKWKETKKMRSDGRWWRERERRTQEKAGWGREMRQWDEGKDREGRRILPNWWHNILVPRESVLMTHWDESHRPWTY